jgi:hypothetical protein
MEMLLILLAFWSIGCSVIFFYYRNVIVASWREPMLRRPILIIESDDWGPGPNDQADALLTITRLLANFSDSDGRRPVMTLGVVLATADGERIRGSGDYHRQSITVPRYVPLLEAIKDGVEAGVFTIQLHGMEHFWPPALMTAGRVDDTVKAWIERAPQSATEELPSALQSRWVDASVLPARRLDAGEIRQAVQEEVNAFQAIFGYPSKVVVPPTFVWNDAVEQAWAESGVAVIVTPGRRYETRGDRAELAGAGAPIYNGQAGSNGTVYLVRNDYFEPALGHTAEQAIAALKTKTRLGRPTLLETHRFNFLGRAESKMRALAELENMLRRALDTHPALAFISTEQLARVLTNLDPDWVELSFRRRLHVWLTRLGELSRLRKLAWISGWIVPGWLLWKLTG